jgi:hypothetical protein
MFPASLGIIIRFVRGAWPAEPPDAGQFFLVMLRNLPVIPPNRVQQLIHCAIWLLNLDYCSALVSADVNLCALKWADDLGSQFESTPDYQLLASAEMCWS